MVLVECLQVAATGSKNATNEPKLSGAGLWPFMVQVEDLVTLNAKKTE
jgi:hypothetical protein